LDRALSCLQFCYFQQVVVFSTAEGNNLTIQRRAFKDNNDDLDADARFSVALDSCWFSAGTSAEDGVTIVSTVDPGQGLATVKIDVEGGMAYCSFPPMPGPTPLANSGG
jgi:hypothetical protein